MDPLYKPLTKEDKIELERRGYKEWEYMTPNKWTDPDSPYCNFHNNKYIDMASNAVILAISIIGRQYCRKNFMPTFFFSFNIVMLPVGYFFAFRFKHVDRNFSPYKPRPTFNQCLEFYPVTRRAWKKALAIREKEMDEIKRSVGSI